MRVYLGSDHAGYELKAELLRTLAADGHQPVDCGPARYDPDDDYPPYCLRTAANVAADPGSFGVVIGGSGNGEQMAANKVAGVRAALLWSEQVAELARAHNDANVAAVGARMHSAQQAVDLVRVFLATPFSGDPRHARRIAQLAGYERTGEVAPVPESGAAPPGGR